MGSLLGWNSFETCGGTLGKLGVREIAERLRTNRSTIDDFPTAASPVVVQHRQHPVLLAHSPPGRPEATTIAQHAAARPRERRESMVWGTEADEREGGLTEQHQLHLDGPLCRAGSSVGHVY